MKHWRSIVILLVSSVIGSAQPLRAGLDEDVSNAIDKGIDYLLKAIEGKQKAAGGRNANGLVALETYALVVAGVSVEDPLIKKNFELLNKMQLGHTYTISCYAFGLDAAMSQIEADQFFLTGRQPRSPRGGGILRSRLDACVKALIRIRQANTGSWNYTAGGPRYDNSNTQFAVLALGVGAKRKVPIPPEVWEQIAIHFFEGQDEKGPEVQERIELLPEEERGEGKNKKIKLIDRNARPRTSKKDSTKPEEVGGRTIVKPVPEAGEFGSEDLKVFARGWTYIREKGRGSTWNMTCAGLSSLILVNDYLSEKMPLDFRNKVNRAIRDGYGWIMQHWNPGNNYYGLYSLEKVGDLGRVRKFGSHDWYEEVARNVVNQQRADGSWPGENEEKVRINSSFALLVLNRATSLLTQRANRMVITGPGAHRGADDRDNWVYVQSLDREFHLPSLFRMLRLRPNPALAKFVTLAVKNYPPEKIGLLIPYLVEAHGRLKSKRFQKLLMDHLADITGVEYDAPESYSTWHRRWKDVMAIGTEIKKDRIDWLIEVYEKTQESLPLREKIIWALSRCQAAKATPLLIEDLLHREQSIRELAYIALTSIPYSKEPLPSFDPRASSRARERQVEAIREWYKRVSGS